MSEKDLTILVIDDTVNILNIIRHFLEPEGYRILTAADPLEGIELAKNSHVDLLILDIMMPRMNGYQVYEVLRQDERSNNIPVIMLTARAVIESTPRPFFYGLYGYLSKPFQKWRLLQMVRDVLDLTQSKAEESKDSGARS